MCSSKYILGLFSALRLGSMFVTLGMYLKKCVCFIAYTHLKIPGLNQISVSCSTI